MLKVFAVGSMLTVAAAAPALAMPAVTAPAPDAPVITVSGGCGPYGHRDMAGFCRPGGGWVRPGWRMCPPGWHPGPYDRRCWRN